MAVNFLSLAGWAIVERRACLLQSKVSDFWCDSFR
jgi:hypothetical protein